MTAHMRGLKQAIEYLKNQDPETGLTLFALRRMVKMGEIACVHSGRKQIIDIDALLEYLHNPKLYQKDKHDGAIRKIDER